MAGLRETLYWPEEDPEGKNDFETRTLPAFEAALSTTASRIFASPLSRWEKVRHRIEPEVRYTYIAEVDQDDLPLFDEKDQIPYTNLITYGLTNFIEGRLGTSSGSEIRQLLKLKLFQSYSLDDPIFPGEDSPERQFSNIRGKLWFSPFSHFNLRSDAEYSLIRDSVVRHNSIAGLSDARGDSLRLEYEYLKDESEQINLFTQIRLWEWADIFASYRYDPFNDIRIETEGGVTYRAQCWNATLSVQDRNRSADGSREGEINVRLNISLVGLGSLGELF